MAANNSPHIAATAAAAAPATAHQPVARLQPMPIWHDGTTYVVAAPQAAATAAAVAAANGHPGAAAAAILEPVKKPRPRKPYTATKTREMWTPEEHARMLEGLKRHKRDWAKVTKFVGTRSAAQVRSHAQKYFDRVQRNKTDDYVPQARPKRKSASPYPRKMRPDATPTITVQPHAAPQYYQIPAQLAPMYGVPPGAFIAAPGAQVASPQPFQYTMHHPATMFAPQGIIPAQMYQQQLHPRQVHPVQHALPARPQFLVAHPVMAPPAQAQQQASSVAASPNISGKQTVQPGAAVPAPTGTAVYSPIPTGTIPPGAVPVTRIIPSYVGHPSPQIGQIPPQAFPSPMSVDGRGYDVPPRSDEMMMVSNQPTVFAPHSPLTPAIPYGASTPSPMVHLPQPTVAQSQAAPHMPTHSHPNGPDPNCAKCIALKRYGNVLQEMGEIHKATNQKPTPEQRSTKEVDKQNPGTPVTPELGTPPGTSLDSKRRDDGGVVSKAAAPEPEKAPASPLLPPPCPPKSRAMAQVSVLRIPKPYDAARPHHAMANDSTKPSGSTGSLASVLTTDRDPKRPRDECDVVSTVAAPDAKRLKAGEPAATRAPPTREQREMFDAVKSLQILGRSTSPNRSD